MNTQEQLRRYILEEHLKGGDSDQLGVTDNLIETGILDSLALVQLVAHLEKTYDIEIKSSEIVPEHFRTIRALTRFVESLLTNS